MFVLSIQCFFRDYTTFSVADCLCHQHRIYFCKWHGLYFFSFHFRPSLRCVYVQCIPHFRTKKNMYRRPQRQTSARGISSLTNRKLSVMKYLQQIPLSSDSPVRVCLYWNYALLLLSTSKEFSYCDAMLCCIVYTNPRDLVYRTSIMQST